MFRSVTFIFSVFFLFICLSSIGHAQYKLDQDFSSLTIPPTGWTIGPVLDENSNPVWTSSPSSGYATGTGSAECHFYSWPDPGIDSLTSVTFTATTSGDTLYFDHAYRTFVSEVDDLNIYYSTDGGATWTSLVDLPGGPTIGVGMVTAAPSSSQFTTPTAGQWLSKKYALPVGINKIRFQTTTAYGNNLYLDNIRVGSPPSIDVAVTSVGSTGSIFAPGGGSVIPTGTVINNGGSPATFTVTRRISPGGYVNTQNITSLAPSTSSPVSFASWNYSVNTLYTIKDSVFISGDTSPVNDTLTGFLTYAAPKTVLILNADNRSRDSLVSHLNLLGLSGVYDQSSTFPNISFSNWRTLIVLMSSGGTWSAALRDSMKSFLDNANDAVNKKSLLIFGNDLGYANDPRRNLSALPADTVFYRQYLRAQYWSDDWIDNFVLSDSTTKGLGSFSSITGQRVNDPYPDCVTPAYWNAGSGTLTPALIPVFESGDGDSCAAVAYNNQFYNVFYGTNVYYGYRVDNNPPVSPNEISGAILNVIKSYIEGSNGALPIELSTFTASSKGNNVALNWETKTEINSLKFEIERNSSGEWTKIGEVNASGNSNSPKKYFFNDKVTKAGTIKYRLKTIDADGTSKYSEVIEVKAGLVPMEFNLAQNYPNPFNPETVIEFTVPEDGIASLKVFNILGQEVVTLFNEIAEAGKYHQVRFNASKLSSGVYYARLEFGDISKGQAHKQMIKKMMFLK